MIVYKSTINHIIELKLLDDTISDLNRDGIFDINCAKYTCNKALVTKIYNKFTNENLLFLEKFRNLAVFSTVSSKSFMGSVSALNRFAGFAE